MTATPAAPAAAARYAGTRVPRVEDARLLTGQGRYVDDVDVPGTLHVCFVRSPFARARVRGVDTAAALAAPGVSAVLTAADLAGLVHEQWHTSVGPASPETRRPPLADDEVRFVGDPVALVVAATRAQAEDAAELVDVDYEPLPAVVDPVEALTSPELVHAAHGSNLVGEVAGRPLEALEETWSGAAHVVDATIVQAACAAVPMEGRGLLVDCSPSTGDITIHAATQAPHEWRMFCARLLAVPEHKIRVIMRDTGGGFGQKVMVGREDQAVMLTGHLLRVPVKWVEDRRENLLAAGKSRREQADVRLSFDADARITGAYCDFLSDAGAYPTPWPVGTAALTAMLFPGPYRVPQAGFRTRVAYTSTAGRSAYRGPWMFETSAREVLLDIAAREMGVDPAELRRRNLLRADEMPYTNPNGSTYDDVAPLETLEQALGMLDYDAFRAEQAQAREQGRYLGVGISTYVEPSTPSFGYYGSEGATIRIEPSGRANVYVAGGSAGNSIETTVVQLAADALGLRLEDVGTVQGDTAVTGFGAGSAGSRSGSMTAGAIGVTAEVLRERLLAIAAHRLEASVTDLELAASRVSVKGNPTAGLSVAELARIAYFEPASLPPEVPAGLEATGRYTARSGIWVNATHVCTCEVDPVTGRVDLLRYIVSEDCGPMINPNVVEGQIAGGVVQGIGQALYEELAYDDEGNPLSTTFADYLLPTTTEVPVLEHGHVENPSKGPGGYKGVGEGGAIGAPAAVVNAVADALSPFGLRLTSLPLGPGTLADLVHAAQAQADAGGTP